VSDQKPAPSAASGPPPGASPAASAAHELAPPPLDRDSPQLTFRALLTGVILGGLLCSCNIYTGLTIGWGLPMSITAVLISYAFYAALRGLAGVRPWGMLENTISMTTVQSAATVSSAGLVAPIPALAMLTGQTLTWWPLAMWVFSVCLVGITVAIPLRRQMLIVDKLPFPSGLATAEMLREMYAQGAEALARVKMLLFAALAAAVVKLLATPPVSLLALLARWGVSAVRLRRWGLPLDKWGFPFAAHGFSAKSLTYSLDPSLLMVGLGGLIGFRACVSLVIGSLLAWLVLAPPLVERSYIRLSISEPLAVLPAGVAKRLPPEPDGYTRYKAETRELAYKGPMTADERDRLLALSADARYREAVRKLYLRSQLKPAVAPAALAQDPDYVTTRDVQTAAPLPGWPKDLTLPREFGHMLRYDAKAGRLVALGVLSDECRTVMSERAAQVGRTRPKQAAACDEFTAALGKLYEETRQPLLPPGVAIPAALADRVTFDASARTLRACGVLTADDAAELKAVVPDNPDFAATVSTLVAGTSFNPAQPGFNDLVQWLLWPGVTLMVVSSLVAFGFSWRSMVHTFTGLGRGKPAAGGRAEDAGEVSAPWFGSALVLALALSVILQIWLFQIGWWAALIGVFLSFALALVAARVSGETGVTPVGAMGKITQLVFGVMVPRNPAPNLMAANVTGGAASQCADLLGDLKAGYLLGASPRKQVIAQIAGAVIGALVGSAVYLVLIPHPAEQLMTEQWAAPAVATWKAVAELFAVGLKALPRGTPLAILIAAALGVLLPVLEKIVPRKAKAWLPSPASLGLGFVIPGYNALSIFLGGALALILSKLFPTWSKRFTVTICAGLVAGESLTGVGLAFERMFIG